MFRFGKHPPKLDYRTLSLSDYVASNIPPHPVAYSALDRVLTSNASVAKVAQFFPMDANDSLGDCTIAALAHARTLFSMLGGAKTAAIPSVASIKKLYMHLTGGVDSGLNMLDVMNYWHKTTFDTEKIPAFVKVNIKNIESVKQAIYLFGACYLGFQVPVDCIKQFSAGQEWTPGKLTQDGHCVLAVAYNAEGLDVLTWGSKQHASWPWWSDCVDEAYAILPMEASKAGYAPGFDFAQLQADLQSVIN